MGYSDADGAHFPNDWWYGFSARRVAWGCTAGVISQLVGVKIQEHPTGGRRRPPVFFSYSRALVTARPQDFRDLKISEASHNFVYDISYVYIYMYIYTYISYIICTTYT